MESQGFHFANPFWLYFVIILPLVMIAIYFASRAKYSTFTLGNSRLVEMASGIFSFQLVPWILRFLVVALCFIAAARPQSGQKKIEEKKPVTDLFVALDVSGSMVTNDLKPSRIAAAKHFLSEFLDKVQNVRVGVTIFARISFTQCPLTTDVEVVKKLLSNVEPAPHSIKLDGTAIGDALVSCLSRLQNGETKKTDDSATAASLPSFLSRWTKPPDDPKEEAQNHQAILLLTDGGDNASTVDPLTAAKIAASRGVKVYAVGMGSKESVPAMFEYPDGHLAPAIDPRTGRIAMSDPVDMGLLSEIARITGAKAYSAQNNESLQAVLDDVARLEKRDVTVTSHWEYQELAPFFLLAAFLILALDIVLETTVLRTLP